MCVDLETLVEHRAKIVRAKKPLVASSFLQGNPGPVPGYLTLITAEILYNFVESLRQTAEVLRDVTAKYSLHSAASHF